MRQSLKPILLAFLIIGGLFGGWYLVHNDSLRPEAIRDYLRSFGSWAPLVFIIGYIIGSVTLMPAAILSITGGLVFGPLFGTVYTVIGASLGAVLSFGIARLLGRGFVQPFLKGKLGQCDAFIGRHSFPIILFMRLVPIFPFDMVNYGAGVCGIKTGSYIVATVVGIVPGSFAYVYLGSSLMNPQYIMLSMLLFIIFVGGSLLIKRYLVGRKKPPEGVTQS